MIKDSPTTPPGNRFAHVRVKDVMHAGILTIDRNTPLPVVAELMAARHVHAVAVTEPGRVDRPLGLVTVLDVARAVAEGSEPTAGQAASQDFGMVSSATALDEAADRMADNSVTHLVVVDAASGRPAGIVSAWDVAAAYGG